MSEHSGSNGGRRVLVVDDDPGQREAISLAFPSGNGTPPVDTAADGAAAVKLLSERDFSLVVTDLKMPRLDGLGLLAHVRENYPDIPVMVMTAYGTPELRGRAVAGGAVQFLEKPFSLAELHQGIVAALQKQSEGGALHRVSCGVFLQLVRMEQKTCTVRVTDHASGAIGVLYFLGGELVDGRLREHRGEPAALHILSWPEVSLAIENNCPCEDRKINTGLQALLLEALRMRDEGGASEAVANPAAAAASSDLAPPLSGSDGERQPEEILRRRIQEALPGGEGQWTVRNDTSWAPLLDTAEQAGKALQLGRLQGALVDLGEREVVVLAPGHGASVILVQRSGAAEKVLGAVVD